MAIHARTVPTCHAVTRAESLVGFGNVPFFTFLQSVGLENGNGAVALDLLLFLTN